MGRCAIVVGARARQGIGGALCRRFAREGLHVAVVGRTLERLEELVEEVRAQGGQASSVVADATRAEDVERVFDETRRIAGTPELVVYNAGANDPRPLLEMDNSYFERMWRLGCFGGFLVGREAARRMLPGGGTLIFTGATASVRSRPPFTAFASAKAALRAVAHGMAREFGPQKLHVAHVVIDGVVDGATVKSRFPQVVEHLGEDGLLQVDAIADAYWTLHTQHPSAWTLDLDLRPYKEKF